MAVVSSHVIVIAVAVAVIKYRFKSRVFLCEAEKKREREKTSRQMAEKKKEKKKKRDKISVRCVCEMFVAHAMTRLRAKRALRFLCIYVLSHLFFKKTTRHVHRSMTTTATTVATRTSNTAFLGTRTINKRRGRTR